MSYQDTNEFISSPFFCLRVGGWGPVFKEEGIHDDLAMIGFKRFVDLTGSDMDPPQHGFFGQSVSLMHDTEAVQMQADSGLLDAVPGPGW